MWRSGGGGSGGTPEVGVGCADTRVTRVTHGVSGEVTTRVADTGSALEVIF